MDQNFESIGILGGSFNPVHLGHISLGEKAYTFRRRDRIAQMVIQRVYQFQPVIVEELDETARGNGGFGHTGK